MAPLFALQISKLNGLLLHNEDPNYKKDSVASPEPENNTVGTQTPPEFSPSDYESHYGMLCSVFMPSSEMAEHCVNVWLSFRLVCSGYSECTHQSGGQVLLPLAGNEGQPGQLCKRQSLRGRRGRGFSLPLAFLPTTCFYTRFDPHLERNLVA